MWLDLAALLILGIFVGMGMLRGALRSLLSVATLGVAYAAAALAASRLGPGLGHSLGTSGLVGMAAAGMAAFALGFVGMGMLSRVLTAMERRRVGSDLRSARDRFLGGVFGGLRGALVVLLLCYLALWVEALRATGTAPDLPELGDSTAARVTGDVVEAGIGAALDEPGGGRLVARMAARPAATLTDLQQLVDSPQLQTLRSDAAFWTYVENGAVDSAMNRQSFLHIVRDRSLRDRFASLGLVDPAAAADPVAFRDAAGEVLRQVGPRIQRVKSDPELQRLIEDPEVQAMLQSGNTLALVTHSGFRRVVARALEAPDV
jgi:membrane protein required for colicin V production